MIQKMFPGLLMAVSFWTASIGLSPSSCADEPESGVRAPAEGESDEVSPSVTGSRSFGLQVFLDAGELVNGELELQAKLEENPSDDETRFALGMLQIARGVERLGQSLHRYGVRSDVANAPVLRLPVPENDDPAPITYTAFRRLFEEFYRDLERAEITLSAIRDENVLLEVKMSSIKLDLTSDGKPSESFGELLTAILRGEPEFLQANPEFIIHFDRGDVAWTRAYCHLVMSIIDFYLAVDSHPEFCSLAVQQFPRLVIDDEALAKVGKYPRQLEVVEPRRLGRARRHLVQVARLNHETWDYIRAETDDSYEWLPNPRQQRGVLGLPVQDEMIDAWLAMVDELEALLQGERSFLRFWGKDGKGLDLKVFFEEPPSTIDIDADWIRELPDRYYTDAPDINIGVLLRVFSMMQNTTGVGYAAWFN